MNTLKTTLTAASAFIALGVLATSAHAVNTIQPLVKLESRVDRATVAAEALADRAARSAVFAQGEGVDAPAIQVPVSTATRQEVQAQLRGNGTAWLQVDGEPAAWMVSAIYAPQPAAPLLAKVRTR